MNEELAQKDFREFLQKDVFRVGDKIKTLSEIDILYHYTTIDALNNIVENNTLWISKADYLNDFTEIEYAERLILEVLEKQPVEQEIKSLVIKMLESSKDTLTNCYILSLTNNNDSLALWSNYTKFEGYNFGIKLWEFENAIHEGEAKISLNDGNKMKCVHYPNDIQEFNCDVQLYKVIYDPDEQKRMITEVIESANDFYKKHAEGSNIYIQHIVYTLFSLLIFFKNPCFKAEEEYRMVFIVVNEHKEKVIYHRISNGAFLPYIKLCFDKKLPIESIRIGPRNKADIAQKGMKSFLNSQGLGKTEVIKSNIPLR